MTPPPETPARRAARPTLGLGIAVVCLVSAGTAYWLASGRTAVVETPSLPASRPLEGHQMRFGPIRPPRPLPDITVQLEDGTTESLAALLRGHWTMMHLMFTSCSTTCPIQGAVFERTQALIAGDRGKLELLSISIDPAGDSPAAMRRWLDSFEAGPQWRGVIPDIAGLPSLAEALNGTGDGVDVHDARVYFIDPSGQLVYATEDMPSPEVLRSLSSEALAGPTG
jgi:protein SCO1/2